MPIYMDRHDVSEAVTAENVAQLHQEDLKIQDRFGCRGLTYWFDDKRKTAFCLIEAPDATAIRKMHDESHGQVPHRIIEVDPAIVESFLGRIEDPRKARDSELNIISDPAFRTIMVLLLKHVSPISNKSRQFKFSLDNFHFDLLQLLNTYDGKTVNVSENRYLISFKFASDAVHAALEIQSLFQSFRDKINDKILLKIGLSAGVPVTEKETIFEDAIKMAERICKMVNGKIVITSEVRELYDNQNLHPLREQGGVFFLTKADERFLTLIMDYAESNWGNINLKVDDFSKPIGYSKSQLYRKLTALTGKSPNSFIKEYRMNEALILLDKNTSNVSEIAFEAGFSSPSYFSKCFQKTFGHSPSEYLLAKFG